MEEDDSYDFAATFARLTCVFEDAAGVASEGQAARLPASRQKKLTAELSALHLEADDILAELRGTL